MAPEIRTEVDIDAPAERVWAVLADFPRYPQWNPFMTHVEGPLRVGGRFRETVHVPGRGDVRFKPRVLRWEPPRAMRWVGGFGPLFQGDHAIELQPLGPRRTRVVQVERIRGLMVPFMGASLRATEEGYRLMNQALKARCEQA